jgi:TetR/AcrR family transcriptional repressor of lmrAB and yxaGH operons
MTKDTRRRMVAGAARMIGTGGVDAMSLRDLAESAGVPLGSTYHHFPGGKAELVDEAVRYVGAYVARIVGETPDATPAGVLQVFADTWRTTLEQSDFRSGCAVLAAATATDPRHHAVAREVFEEWQQVLTTALTDSGVDPARAPRLARTIVATIEGAIGLARASGTADPLDEVVAELSELVESARAS